MTILTASTTEQYTTSDPTNWSDIGLRISLPVGTFQGVVIFNAPSGYVTGTDLPGAMFRVTFSQGRGQPTPSVLGAGEYTTFVQGDNSRKPITVVAPLSYSDPEGPTVAVSWRCVRPGNTAYLGGDQALPPAPTATLTALLE